jgi:beta-glucanase (GH16 family)
MISVLRILAPISVCLLLAGPANTQAPSSIEVDKNEWMLVWQDEFEGAQLNSSHWSTCKRGTPDWMNTMSDDPRLCQLKGGVLHLRGIKNDRLDEDPSPYITAGITSQGKYSFQYGKVMIRARFKSAQGAWPALWMLGENGQWPGNGEIDLMEHLNFDSIVYQTVHSEYTHDSSAIDEPKHGSTSRIKRDDWNTYGCEWNADKIVMTVNGKSTHTYPRVEALGEKQWPFHQKFYFILSMQIGGRWVNQSGATDPTDYPAGMEVDWIRVFKPRQ